MYKKILIYNSGGGLSDRIQLFSLISSLKKYFNNKLKEYNLRLDKIDLDLKYLRFSWQCLLRIKKKL